MKRYEVPLQENGRMILPAELRHLAEQDQFGHGLGQVSFLRLA